MSTPLLIAQNICLDFPSLTPADRKIMSNPVRFLADFYFSRPRRKPVRVLEDISFDVHSGDRLGILGLNGAGKSTLLRLLAGIYHPTSGSLTVHGQAKGLFDVSMGMQQQATGLENIYLRGLQMGISLGEIKKKLPDIMEFTELGNDIHKVFDTYSSGMRLRLAFAVSTMIKPDILLMDEWLGAGDARFKAKVKTRMDSLIEGSHALVLASHSVPLLKQLCNKGLVLDKGKQMFFGDLSDAIDHYETIVKPKNI
jgi:ABC-type polysaccharide/polyol phosphate transport system ATPase subunit